MAWCRPPARPSFPLYHPIVQHRHRWCIDVNETVQAMPSALCSVHAAFVIVIIAGIAAAYLHSVLVLTCHMNVVFIKENHPGVELSTVCISFSRYADMQHVIIVHRYGKWMRVHCLPWKKVWVIEHMIFKGSEGWDLTKFDTWITLDTWIYCIFLPFSSHQDGHRGCRSSSFLVGYWATAGSQCPECGVLWRSAGYYMILAI